MAGMARGNHSALNLQKCLLLIRCCYAAWIFRLLDEEAGKAVADCFIAHMLIKRVCIPVGNLGMTCGLWGCMEQKLEGSRNFVVAECAENSRNLVVTEYAEGSRNLVVTEYVEGSRKKLVIERAEGSEKSA